jgi:uncharacterized protein YqeY
MLIDQIKSDNLAARKAHDSAKASLLTTLLGEAEMIGKNDGNRPTTDAEVQEVIQKFVKNNKLTITALKDVGAEQFHKENEILAGYLPKMLSEDELKAVILSYGTKNMGEIMKQLKTNHAGMYDGQMASKIAKSL